MSEATKLKYCLIASDAGTWGDDPDGEGAVIPVLRSTEIGLDGSVDTRAPALRSLTSAERARTRLQEGDVLVVRSSGSDLHLGKSGYVNTSATGLCFSNFLQRLRFTPEHSPRFGWYFLNSVNAKQQIRKLSSTTTGLQNLSASLISELEMPTPPLNVQRRIADFLDAETARLDRLIHLQGQAVERLDEREMAQLDSALDDLIHQWGAVPLRRFLRGVDQGTSPQADAFPAGLDEWGVLKVSCLRPGRFFPDENKRLPVELEPDSNHEVKTGDLLITRANTPQLVGSTAVVPQTRGRLLLSDKIFRVRIDQRITADFVATVARGTRIRDLCAATSNGASQSMANIRFEEVKAWPIPAAPLDTQRDVVHRINRQRLALDSLRAAVERQARLLVERRQSLITAAVTGQFDVTTASGRNVTEGVSA